MIFVVLSRFFDGLAGGLEVGSFFQVRSSSLEASAFFLFFGWSEKRDIRIFRGMSSLVENLLHSVILRLSSMGFFIAERVWLSKSHGKLQSQEVSLWSF